MWLAVCSPVWLESLHARTPPCAVPRAPPARMMGGFAYTGTTRPGKQSPRRIIPEEIPRPDYAVDGKPKARGPLFPWQIEVKSQKDIEGMRASGRIAREVRGCGVAAGHPNPKPSPSPIPSPSPNPRQVLDAAGRMVAPGVATDAIDALVTEETIKRGAYPNLG